MLTVIFIQNIIKIDLFKGSKFMKKFINRLLFSKGAIAFFTAFSAVSALFFYSVRYGFVFVDNVLYTGFSLGLFVFVVLGGICLLLILNAKARKKYIIPEKFMNVIAFISEALAVVAFVYSVVAIITDHGMSLSSAFALFKSALPVWAFVVGVAFFAFAFPLIKKKTARKVISCVTAAVLLFVAYAGVFPVASYKFTSGPVVFDNGSEYSVVFSTNDQGTGYIEYEYGGENVRIYDESSGRKNADSIIHTVTVPKEQLSGNTYKVGSTRVIDELSYGGRNGKTIESESVTFNDAFGSEMDILTVSDWHTKNERAEAAAAALGDYQALVLLGDCAPGLMSEKDIADYILAFAYDLTLGEMPVIYVRGNHETRGTEAADLADHLGYEDFYYTTSLGNYNFIVLDSCEDKEDSHPEYGGMVDYENYRADMVEWLETLEGTNSNTIALCHAREICREPELSQRALAKLDSLGTSLLVSGHEHILEFDNSGALPVLVDGGVDSNGSGSYVASIMHISPDGIKLESADQNGEMLLSENVAWR